MYYTFDELQECADNDFKNLNVVKLAKTPPHEIGAWLERLSGEDREIVLKKLSVDNVAEVLAGMDAEDSAEIISEMRDAKAIKILSSLAPDDAAGLLRELEDDTRDRLLNKMPKNLAATLTNLLTYDPNTAGGVMTPYIATFTSSMTVDDAIKFLRQKKDIAENVASFVVLVAGPVALALLHSGLVTGRNLLHAPAGDVLRRGVAADDIIYHLMVKLVGDAALDFGEIDHHAVAIQLAGLAIDGDLPIVAVQLRALARVIQFETMRPGDFYMLGYVIHFS